MKTPEPIVAPSIESMRIQCLCVAIVTLSIFILSDPNDAVAQSDAVDASAIIGRQTTDTPQGAVTTGKFRVFENRQAKSGRQIHLEFVILHAKSETPKSDPVFFFVGGPGQAAVTTSDRWGDHWIRQDRDFVLINQRGTGGDNRLAFDVIAEGNVLQQYLDPIMAETTARRNLERLSKKADLRMYSTPIAMDDINDFRRAMGYDRINIMGGSYGTRACLVYIRRHGETVRTSTLLGCAPIEFRNPLYHAEGAQRALDLIFDEVESRDDYRAALGDLRKKFVEIVERFEQEPVTVQITNKSTGKSEPVKMDRRAFLASVRFQMYYLSGSRKLPKLLCDLHDGDFRPWVLGALQTNVALRQSLALGMLLSVTTAEDVARIDPDEIDGLTKATFFGPWRVRSQLAAAAVWPKSDLPANFGEPVGSNVQTLIFSGSIDPVTPPKWGEMIHKNFPNSVHLVIPAAHDIGGPCVDRISKRFLDSGNVEGLSVDCVKTMKLPPLLLRDP